MGSSASYDPRWNSKRYRMGMVSPRLLQKKLRSVQIRGSFLISMLQPLESQRATRFHFLAWQSYVGFIVLTQKHHITNRGRTQIIGNLSLMGLNTWLRQSEKHPNFWMIGSLILTSKKAGCGQPNQFPNKHRILSRRWWNQGSSKDLGATMRYRKVMCAAISKGRFSQAVTRTQRLL